MIWNPQTTAHCFGWFDFTTKKNPTFQMKSCRKCFILTLNNADTTPGCGAKFPFSLGLRSVALQHTPCTFISVINCVSTATTGKDKSLVEFTVGLPALGLTLLGLSAKALIAVAIRLHFPVRIKNPGCLCPLFVPQTTAFSVTQL